MAPKFNEDKERQTHIIDDATALNLNLTNSSVKGSKTTKRTQGFSFSTAQNAGITKTKRSANPKAFYQSQRGTHASASAISRMADTSSACFYTTDGLNIPLYNEGGKKFTNARDGKALAHKASKQKLLDNYVRKYAGDAKVDEMKGWEKSRIAEWIEQVETRAFGKGPRKVVAAQEKVEEEIKQKQQEQGKQEIREKRRIAMQSRTERSMSEEMVMYLNEEARAPVMEMKKDRATNGEKANKAPSTIVTMNNKRKRENEQVRPTAAQQQTVKKLKLGHAAPTGAQKHAEPIQPRDIDRPAVPKTTSSQSSLLSSNATLSKTANSLKQGIMPSFSSHKPQPQQPTPQGIMSSARKPQQHPQRQQRRPVSNTTVWDSADEDLYLPKFNDLHTLEQHPLISEWGLDAEWHPIPTEPSTATPLHTISLPATKEHLIACANSYGSSIRRRAALHTTLIPQCDIEYHSKVLLQGKKVAPPHRRYKTEAAPYLKPGKHGWDYDKHRWSFENDPDLVTGFGHQVEEDDEKKLSEQEFRAKYPGVLANQWPCGCQMPWDDEDSECED
ncbi:hypothetical protein N0V90_000885 [Kalmusia sp. IMI 367209]|nr:hypothetical protein N0V90_000885 [Kalmusia sp. IMI 367209]